MYAESTIPPLSAANPEWYRVIGRGGVYHRAVARTANAAGPAVGFACGRSYLLHDLTVHGSLLSRTNVPCTVCAQPTVAAKAREAVSA